MKETGKNKRNLAVLFISCLLCVFFGLLMGLSIPNTANKQPARDEASIGKDIILLSDYVSSAAFGRTVEPFLTCPGVNAHNLMGTPLKLVKIRFYRAFKNDLGKKDALLLEKGLLNVSEALFSSFAEVPPDVCDILRDNMFSLLGFPDKGPRSGDIYAFGVIGEDGASVESLVLFIPYPELQIVQLKGDINPEMFSISSCK